MLTDTQIRSAKLAAKGQSKTLPDANGLQLYITHTGKYWRIRYRFNNKQQIMALGEYPTLSLVEARQKLAQIKKLLNDDINPLLERKKSYQSNFEQIAWEWFENWQKDKSEKSINVTKSRLQNIVIPKIGNYPIDKITTLTIVELVKAIADTGTIDTAYRILNKIAQIFRYAMIKGYLNYNPASFKPSDVLPSYKATNLPRIDAKELGELLRAIEVYQGTPATRVAIKLLALTFVRTGELIGAKWSEFDFNNARWDIPAERMKMKTPHIVPLAKQTISLLKSLHQISGNNEYLFPSEIRTSKTGVISNGTILGALKRMGYQGKMTGHGFRGLASTILHEQEYNHDHIELQLAHAPRNAVSAAYNHALYLAPRTKMMQDWADYLDRRRNEG
ncbi:MAG: hypothetical protein RL017_901 [Pseudomonadota bacterium]|jgi:integrase